MAIRTMLNSTTGYYQLTSGTVWHSSSQAKATGKDKHNSEAIGAKNIPLAVSINWICRLEII